jgi:hypothetical protein
VYRRAKHDWQSQAKFKVHIFFKQERDYDIVDFFSQQLAQCIVNKNSDLKAQKITIAEGLMDCAEIEG